jgi:hypothetical protein
VYLPSTISYLLNRIVAGKEDFLTAKTPREEFFVGRGGGLLQEVAEGAK